GPGGGRRGREVALAVQAVEENERLGSHRAAGLDLGEGVVDGRQPGRRELQHTEAGVEAEAPADQASQVPQLGLRGGIGAAVSEEEGGGHAVAPMVASRPPISSADRETTSPTTRTAGDPSSGPAPPAMSETLPVTWRCF